MNKADKVIPFPRKKEPKRKKVNLDAVKYFDARQIKALRKAARSDAELALQKDQCTAIRSWAVIDLLTCTGLRVSEASNLCCGDLKLEYGQSEVYVRDGKGGVSGSVQIPSSLKKHLKAFLRWKSGRGEATEKDDFLFIGQRGKWTSQAIQQIVKLYLKQLGFYEERKSVHAIRHSYGYALYRKERDIKCVQRQLRHVSLASTAIYTHLTKEEIGDQVKGLWD